MAAGPLKAGVTASACLATLLLAPPAAAHGLEVPPSPPIPLWLFSWAAAGVLVLSFVALATLWSTPRMRGLAAGPSIPLPATVAGSGRVALGALGLALFAVTVWAGLTGTERPQDNVAPSMVFAGFWVAVPVASLVLGDLWRALSPWRTVAELAARTGVRAAGRRYPARAGAWPAAAVLLAFGWLELVDPGRDAPRLLATLALVYAGAMLAGTAVYGRTFLDRADGFGVAFTLLSRLAPLRWHARAVRVRWPGAGVAEVDPGPGLAAVVVVLIGTTTYDGLSTGAIWTRSGAIGARLDDAFAAVGLAPEAAATATRTVGLLLCVALVAAVVSYAAARMRDAPRRPRSPDEPGAPGAEPDATHGPESAPHRKDPATSTRALVGELAPTLVPIAAGYLVAHYVTLLLYQGQALVVLLSDPRGTGADWFGTAGRGLDPAVLSPETTWYVQVLALVVGHVVALAAAHDVALRRFGDARTARRAHAWSLVVMVAFTALGLRLLQS